MILCPMNVSNSLTRKGTTREGGNGERGGRPAKNKFRGETIDATTVDGTTIDDTTLDGTAVNSTTVDGTIQIALHYMAPLHPNLFYHCSRCHLKTLYPLKARFLLKNNMVPTDGRTG